MAAKFGKTKLIQTYLELKCLCALVPKFLIALRKLTFFCKVKYAIPILWWRLFKIHFASIDIGHAGSIFRLQL